MNGGLHISPYDLPDAELMKVSAETARCRVFVPPGTMVVIGKGSDPARELRIENIVADGVPVLRRGTGGCAVVLTADMLAVSFALQHTPQRKSSEYFRVFNALVMRALEKSGVRGLEHAGTSDIALGGRKIAGTAIYRNRELVFYHAIIVLSAAEDVMERYLQQPPRSPAYRAGRSHAQFVTSLSEAGFAVEISHFQQEVEREFRSSSSKEPRIGCTDQAGPFRTNGCMS
jgi:lipoate-protein ligase A